LARLKTNREKMAGMKTLKPVDVVAAGGGWSGLLIAKALATRTSLEVLVLERGPARTQRACGGDGRSRLRIAQQDDAESR
jgi:choline dehydrogenase-like flavoprotein